MMVTFEILTNSANLGGNVIELIKTFAIENLRNELEWTDVFDL